MFFKAWDLFVLQILLEAREEKHSKSSQSSQKVSANLSIKNFLDKSNISLAVWNEVMPKSVALLFPDTDAKLHTINSLGYWSHFSIEQRWVYLRASVKLLIQLLNEQHSLTEQNRIFWFDYVDDASAELFSMATDFNFQFEPSAKEKSPYVENTRLQGHEEFSWLSERLALVCHTHQVKTEVLVRLRRLKKDSETSDVALNLRLIELEGDYYRLLNDPQAAEDCYLNFWQKSFDGKRNSLIAVKLLGLNSDLWKNADFFASEWKRLLKQLEYKGFVNSKLFPQRSLSPEDQIYTIIALWSHFREEEFLQVREKRKKAKTSHLWEVFKGPSVHLSQLNFPYLAEKPSVLARELLAVLKVGFCKENPCQDWFLAIGKLAIETKDWISAGEALQIYAMQLGAEVSSTFVLALLDIIDEWSQKKGCHQLFLNNALVGCYYSYFVLGCHKAFKNYHQRINCPVLEESWKTKNQGQLSFWSQVALGSDKELESSVLALRAEYSLQKNAFVGLLCQKISENVAFYGNIKIDESRFLNKHTVPLSLKVRMRSLGRVRTWDEDLDGIHEEFESLSKGIELSSDNVEPTQMSFFAKQENLSWLAKVLVPAVSINLGKNAMQQNPLLWLNSAAELLNLLKLCSESKEQVEWLSELERQLWFLDTQNADASRRKRMVG